MQYTTNYNLKKPEGTDNVNVQDFNDNADTIDQKIKEQENTLASCEKTTNKGQPGGYASLDNDGNVPAEQLENLEVPVTSVNNKTGDVVLSADDFGAETPAGAQDKADTAEANAKAYTDTHEQKAAPHSGHETPAGAQDKANAAANAVQQNLNSHKAEKVHQEEIHGLRVNKTTNEFEYYDGEQWRQVSVDALQIRDNPELNLRFKVSNTAPAAIDGRVYYNTEDKLFYVARNDQWWRLYVGGDEKLEQNPPDQPPQLESRTDTTIKLVADPDMEYMYQGGDWQESSLFTGLSRNTEYTFYSRYKETEIYKASPPGPSAKYSTDKGTQAAPAAPNVTNIKWDRATVTGVSGTEVRLGSGTWYDSPHTFTGLTEDTRYQAYARYKETSTHYASPASPGRSFTTPLRAPGPATLISGTMEEGFFGEVSSSELITGDALASECGISQGTSQYSTAGWLKFAYKDKILFVAKKPIRNSISWDAINTANCVYGDSGDKQIIVDGRTYKVRLMRALDPSINPKAAVGANFGTVNHGSEWNRLMCQIHEQALNKSWDYPNNVESDIGVLEHNLGNGNQGMYNDADLVVTSGDGSLSWCQEMGKSTSVRVYRGDGGVSDSYGNTSSGTNAYYGWRPVLELVP